MRKLLGLAALSLLGSSFLPTPVFAQQPAVLHVNRTDSTCAGQSPCFKTIQAAINAAHAGDAIEIQAGTYPEQLSITGKNNFPGATETDRIIIETDPATQPGEVVLTGAPGACTGNYAIRLQQSKFITIRSLTITGTGGQAISLLGGNNQNQDIHIELNRIFANGSGSCNGGITVARGNLGTLIVNNLIYANGRNGISFIDADGGPHYIINNTIYGNQWNGVDVARNHTTTLANNIINNNGTASGTTGGRFGVRREGSTSPQPAGIKLLNNLICGNTQGQVTAEVLDATDSSNFTPLGNEGPGVGALPGCEAPANLFTDVDGPDNVSDTTDDDFSLKLNSLAIDVGMDPRTLGFNPSYNPIFEADFVIEGIRPADGNADGITVFDAGAFEFISPNQAPIAHAGIDRTVILGSLVNLDGSASFDPDGNAITYQWTQTGGPVVSLSSPTVVNPAFTAPAVQTPTVLVFQLTVSDGFASSSATVRITVEKPNSPPMLTPIGSKTVSVGDTLTFSVNATDPENDPLTFSVAPLPLPANASFDTNTRVFTFTPLASQAGSFNLTFAVSDGRGGTALETITVTVTSGLSIAITSPTNGATVPAGSLIVRGTVQTSGGETGVTVNGFPAGVQGNNFTALVFVAPDTTSLTATAVSRSGATATHMIAVTVSATAPSPILLHTSPTNGAAPLTVEFSLFGDVQITQVTLDADGDGIVDFSGSQLAQHSFTFNQPGTYVATAIAADAQGVQLAANAVVQVLDPAQLDTVLQVRWAAMKDALRIGNIGAALNEIATRSRPRYEEAFQLIASQLQNVDQILTNPTLVRIGNFSATYEAARIDDGVEMSFEIRFAIDGDGLWRIEAF
jgi:K319L-like, PKD domain/Bacterial Ig domain/Right handed beta helix region